jgi:hypothetical protein
MPVHRRWRDDRHAGQPRTRHAEISPEKAPPGLMAMIIIRSRKTGDGLRYTISDEWRPTILGKSEPPARFDAAMAADGRFKSDPAPWRSRVSLSAAMGVGGVHTARLSGCFLPYYTTYCRFRSPPTAPPVMTKFHSFQNLLEY